MADKKMSRFADHSSSDPLLMRPGSSPTPTISTSRRHECERTPTLTNNSSSAGYIALVVVGVMGMVAAVVMLLVAAGSSINISGNSENYESEVVVSLGLGSIDAACRATLYPEICMRTLLTEQVAYTASRPEGLARTMVSTATQGVHNTLGAVFHAAEALVPVKRVCYQTLGSSIEQLRSAHAALLALSHLDAPTSKNDATVEDIKTLLSAAMEFHTTCIDALMETGADLDSHIVETKERTEKLLSNALAFVNAMTCFGNDLRSWKLAGAQCDVEGPAQFLSPHIAHPMKAKRRSLITPSSTSSSSSVALHLAETPTVPSWMSLEQQENLAGVRPAACDVVVAKHEGGGPTGLKYYASIQAAVDAAPQTGSKKAKRYVVCIKKGVYDEQVIVPNSATNFMFLGHGASKSIITGDRSVALTPNMTTFMSATLIVKGYGFIGHSFTVRNTAGAEGGQAVAMRVSADKAAFYQCTFDSWQDTLYAHAFRQYYRDSTILGTIDFIFGNSAAAFQSCTLVAKQSTIPGQTNIYTAQGKQDPGQNTGFSFQSCTFDATEELKANTSAAQFKTYLGRPWRTYSTHVNLKCNLMDHIDPAGWLPWDKSSEVGLNTSFYAEWEDFGSGADIAHRVDWSHQITDQSVAQKFQALPFVQVDEWIPTYMIPLTTDLP